MKEEQKDELNTSSVNVSARSSPSSVVPPPLHQAPKQQQRIRHVYLQQQNVYGRYVPFLLIKDKLHSQVDSSGSSALIHMCSRNSPYIPLYLSTLKEGDPILNRPTNLGHTPLDVAGMYCKRQYIQLLKAKGAVDDGRVDNWAIQGANLANWSGKVDLSKKTLIHWAAYNNLAQVLAKYAQAGANLNQVDHNGNTPIDLAAMSKNYESVQVLAKLGYRPKKEHLEKAESPYLDQLFKQLDRPAQTKTIIKSLKLSFIPLVLLTQFFANQTTNTTLSLLVLAVWLYLVIRIPVSDSNDRPTKFFSELVNRQINYASNHKAYVLLLVLFVLSCLQCLIEQDSQGFLISIYFWVLLGIVVTFGVNLGIMFYGILTNTTPSEMLQAHKHAYLWPKIDYITHRNMLIRSYKNPNRHDYQANVQAYLNY